MPEFIPYRFQVALSRAGQGTGQIVCRGAFSEVSGLEATMTVKGLREGGRNWGEVQLAGPTRFATIVLKRGVTEVDDLYSWFDVTTRQANYGYRLDGRIEVFDPGDARVRRLSWRLHNAMATRFKGPELSATAHQVAIEELHLVHEGLTLEHGAEGGGHG